MSARFWLWTGIAFCEHGIVIPCIVTVFLSYSSLYCSVGNYIFARLGVRIMFSDEHSEVPVPEKSDLQRSAGST